MAEALSDDDLKLLEEPHLGHVATVMEDGTPQITPVWVDTQGGTVRFNTARHRVKARNLERDPHVAVSVVDKANDYRWVVVRGTAQLTEEGADAHIDKLAKKYLGVDSYPMRNAAETRVTVTITPDSVIRMAT